MNNIFVGNLSFKATKEDVIKLFEIKVSGASKSLPKKGPTKNL